MSFELIYTSMPRGLKTGSRGFCTVAFTDGMPPNYVRLCESLSGYVHVYPPHDPKYDHNPVAFSHYISGLGGRMYHVLSRVSAYGVDYSGRSNKLAHHVMLSSEECSSAGPAGVMLTEPCFVEEWKDEPHLISKPPILAAVDDYDVFPSKWKSLMGDAGWAGLLAERFMSNPDDIVYIIFEPGMDVLPLVNEALHMLPAERRWDVSFNTYFVTLPAGVECNWRFCLPDSDVLRKAQIMRDACIIDLKNPVPLTQSGEWIQAAREGRRADPDVIKPVQEYVTAKKTVVDAAVKEGGLPPALPETNKSKLPLRSSHDVVQKQRSFLTYSILSVAMFGIVLLMVLMIKWSFNRKPDVIEEKTEAGEDVNKIKEDDPETKPESVPEPVIPVESKQVVLILCKQSKESGLLSQSILPVSSLKSIDIDFFMQEGYRITDINKQYHAYDSLRSRDEQLDVNVDYITPGATKDMLTMILHKDSLEMDAGWKHVAALALTGSACIQLVWLTPVQLNNGLKEFSDFRYTIAFPESRLIHLLLQSSSASKFSGNVEYASMEEIQSYPLMCTEVDKTNRLLHLSLQQSAVSRLIDTMEQQEAHCTDMEIKIGALDGAWSDIPKPAPYQSSTDLRRLMAFTGNYMLQQTNLTANVWGLLTASVNQPKSDPPSDAGRWQYETDKLIYKLNVQHVPALYSNMYQQVEYEAVSLLNEYDNQKRDAEKKLAILRAQAVEKPFNVIVYYYDPVYDDNPTTIMKWSLTL